MKYMKPRVFKECLGYVDGGFVTFLELTDENIPLNIISCYNYTRKDLLEKLKQSSVDKPRCITVENMERQRSLHEAAEKMAGLFVATNQAGVGLSMSGSV